jgi:WhiB family redox-sensing transcriptional regulator
MVAIEPLDGEPPEMSGWTLDAACRGRTDLFFPPRAERPQARLRRETQARLLCESCPVIDPCRSHARAHREYGFWGAESEEERHVAGFTVAAPIGVRARGSHEGVVVRLADRSAS